MGPVTARATRRGLCRTARPAPELGADQWNGGQLELSSLPAATLTECVSAMTADLTAVRTALRRAGSPHRLTARVARAPCCATSPATTAHGSLARPPGPPGAP
ncbi:glutamate-cysteine ligase family protein [Streptomyces sp. KL116D]|uniref:glutamate-cysteine ligase family protein n=1 Tax=Streptomyces sp. KL116D TaxID=3045152 RepID=UPI003558FA98